MIKNTLCALLMLCSAAGFGQVVINELDTDTPSTDDKEFIELKSIAPNFALDGYVLVFFNGSETSSTGNKSYFAIDLDGYSTDINGLILIGNDLVSPVPDKFWPTSTMQNGADAVGLYLGSASDFPDQTIATTTNLIDALAYDTSDPDATILMNLLGLTIQINENEHSNATSHSIQRKNDGTYEVKTPTPGANNDGSGVQFNGISITTSATTLNEGESFTVTFTTQNPVTSNLTFTYSLNSGSFNGADFTGNLTASISTGTSSYSTTITIIDDVLDEGDELLKVRFGTLPTGFKRLNDNIEVRIIDNDFTIAAWGTPLNPTYGVVTPQIPPGYYTTLEGKTGAVLKQAIQDIIADPAVVRAQNYGDATYILYDADQNPANSNQVWLIYTEQGREKYKFQSTASNTGSWNREHIFPQSRGGFQNGTSSTPDGINVYLPTNADDILAGHADAHHLRAVDGPENSSRGNRDYGSDYNGPAGNQGSWNGDVSRSAFYMAVRYNGLSLVSGDPADTTIGQLGDLATMLVWNHSDPADDFEMNRNNIIYNWQYNRNPFIDYPNLADYIWGTHVGEPWYSSLSTNQFGKMDVVLYPNPTTSQFSIAGVSGNAALTIYTLSGIRIMEQNFSDLATFDINLAGGIYIVKVKSDSEVFVTKLIVR